MIFFNKKLKVSKIHFRRMSVVAFDKDHHDNRINNDNQCKKGMK